MRMQGAEPFTGKTGTSYQPGIAEVEHPDCADALKAGWEMAAPAAPAPVTEDHPDESRASSL